MPTQENLPASSEATSPRDIMTRIEALLDEARRAKVPNFTASLRFADGSSVRFVTGQSAEEERRSLALLKTKIAAGN